MTPSTLRRAIGVLVALTVFLAACTDNSSDASATSTTRPDTSSTSSTGADTDSTSSSTASSSTPPARVSTIDWEICGQLECGTVEVPVDYADPDGETIPIQVNILRAADTDRSRGALLVNPGGPGGSGLDLAEEFAFGAFPRDLTDNFDIVGFDPRGVGESGPDFACGASGEQLEVLSSVDELIDEADEILAVEQAVGLCSASMGDAAGAFGTDLVVRDMDEIRKALGEEQISFLGYSYGSVIGVWYASVFPENVRAMVIDGADNPVDDIDTAEQRLESAREEIGPLEDLLKEALAACQDPSCPIYNNGDPEGYYYEAINKLDLVNQAMADNPDAGFLGLITPLYSQGLWPTLWESLADLQERNDPGGFVGLAEFQLGDDPGAVNFTAHVNCLDSWSLQPSFDRDARQTADAEFFAVEDQLIEEFPLLGAIESESTPTCAFYDLINPPPLDVPFDGGGVPIVVIGNTSDPVTSFGESEELVLEILDNGILVEVDHPDHTVYPSNDCVNDIVHDVLLDLRYPEGETVCQRRGGSLGGETGELLNEVCTEIVREDRPSLSGDDVAAICEAFVTDAYARLGEEAIEGALFSDDVDSGAALLDVLFETVDAFTG